MWRYVNPEDESAPVGSTMTEGKIISWIKSEGDVLSKGESIIVFECDKADMDVETFYDGILPAIVIPKGESAHVGSSIGILVETEADVPKAKAKAAARSPAASPPPTADPAPLPLASTLALPLSQSGRTVATPYAKKLAKQHKVDIGKLVGMGAYERITAADMETATRIALAAA